MMNRKYSFVIVLLMVLCLGTANGKIKLPAIMGDHMVLQRETKANLWGWADANAKVTITCSWDGKSYSTQSGPDGKWLQAVDTPEAGGPYDITVSDGEELKITDVLIGEVWICSGQSNMQMPVGGWGSNQFTNNSVDHFVKANPNRPLRMAQVQREINVKPADDCHTKWQTCNPQAVRNISAVAYFFAYHVQEALDIPIGFIETCWGGSKIEAWMDRPNLEKYMPNIDYAYLDNPSLIKKQQHTPIVLYNAMLYPLRHYTLRGAIWYQGEANTPDWKIYPAMQKAMVELWRKDFSNPDMPFYFVQIAPFGGQGYSWALMREAQAKSATEIPHSGMVVTTDLGESPIIHPAEKEPIGKRLAMWALGDTYKLDVVHHSPAYTHMEVEGGRIVVHFDHCDYGLHREPERDANLEGFEIAGADKVFHPANAEIGRDSKSVYVSCPAVPNPVAVRYCFHDYCEAHLYNNFGIPVAPFRTDDWEIKR